jgi:hypothetical protein
LQQPPARWPACLSCTAPPRTCTGWRSDASARKELIDLATTEYERTGERSYRADAGFARARVRLELGDGGPAEAERWLLEALGAGRAADNLQWELIISSHLARLAPRTGKLREAHDRLARHYVRLTEGFDRGPAREAKATLDELAARLDAGTPGSVR